MSLLSQSHLHAKWSYPLEHVFLLDIYHEKEMDFMINILTSICNKTIFRSCRHFEEVQMYQRTISFDILSISWISLAALISSVYSTIMLINDGEIMGISHVKF